MSKLQLVLASGSPRRKELLGWLEIPFTIATAHCEEITDHVEPGDQSMDLAKQKGRALIETDPSKYENSFVISSDTVVALGDKVYGKPRDIDQARTYLKELSGTTHQVFSGVCFHHYSSSEQKWKSYQFAVCTDVTFDLISDEILELYLQTGDSLDKAGAYGIQGAGLTFVKSVNGSYSNVVGFPLVETICEMKKYLKIEDGKKLRELFEGVQS